jgi:hypothetical protein
MGLHDEYVWAKVVASKEKRANVVALREGIVDGGRVMLFLEGRDEVSDCVGGGKSTVKQVFPPDIQVADSRSLPTMLPVRGGGRFLKVGLFSRSTLYKQMSVGTSQHSATQEAKRETER